MYGLQLRRRVYSILLLKNELLTQAAQALEALFASNPICRAMQ